MAVNYKPAGCQAVIPYLIIPEPDKTIAFTKQVFGAREAHVSRTPDGKVMHASMAIGDAMLMMGASGGPFPPVPGLVYIYVSDIDAAYQRALAAGATSLREPADQFYGDRSGGVLDSQGTQWWLGTHIEDVSNEEIERRAQAAYRQQAAQKA